MSFRHNKTAVLNNELLSHYGKVSEAHITEDEMASVSYYAKQFKINSAEQTVIDEITWQDLDMDRLYGSMNTTLTSCGDCCLYEALRHPYMKAARLKNRQKDIHYFETHENERLAMQRVLSEVGRPSEGSFYEALENAEQAAPIGSGKYIILAILTLFSIVMLFIRPIIGICTLVPLLIINILLSLKMKDSTGRAIEGFRAILRFTKASDDLKGMNIPELKDALTGLSECAAKFKAFRRGAFLVTGRYQYAESPGEMLLQYLKLLFHVDLIKFDSMLSACKGHKDDAMTMHNILGEFDLAIAAASYRQSLQKSCTASFSEAGESSSLSVTDLIHPFVKEPVPNSVCLTGGNLMTGANASGKSTFLKACALSVILAQSMGYAPCASYRAPFMRVMTSMALKDNLQKGESYFIVEIRSIKRIVDASKDPTPMLIIVDEVLRGTNTIERIASSKSILLSLKKPHMITLAATHDIELTYLLENDFTNRHFDEEVEGQEVHFSYKLKNGRSTRRNAIRLLENTGFDRSVYESAARCAEYYEKTGEWQK